MLISPVVAAALFAAPPQIDVYTMGTGDALFHRFGHAAICATDPDQPKRAVCFNYGTTDFGSPPRELGWAFVRGDAPFWVSKWPLDRMLAVYVTEDRSVWRQRLELTPAQAEAILTKLKADAATYDGEGPEGSYDYHHFQDNCTTRIRDLLDEATEGALSEGSDTSTGQSYREYGEAGLADMPLIPAAGQLLVGRAADEDVDAWQAMFLPRYLRAELEQRLAAPPEVIHTRQGPPPVPEGQGGSRLPYLLALVALTSLPALIGLAWARASRVWFAIAGVLLGLLGLALWALALVSHMPELRYNEALLLFWPTDLGLGLMRAEHRRTYARVRVAVITLCGLGLAVGLLRQPLALIGLAALIPMAAMAWAERATKSEDAPSATDEGAP